MSHTVGPWTVRIEDGVGYVVQVQSPQYDVAQILDVPESPYNAHLIAAAPTMLEALEMLLHHRFNGKERVAILKAAINQAKGEV